MLFKPDGHAADIAVPRCELSDKKSCLERFCVGLADGHHQDFLVHVNPCTDGTPDVPIRRINDPGAVFHCQETQFLGGVGISGFEMFSLVSSVLGCHVLPPFQNGRAEKETPVLTAIPAGALLERAYS